MFGRKKSPKRFIFKHLPTQRAIGEFVEIGDYIYVVRAYTGHRLITDGVGSGYFEYYHYLEFHSSIIDKMRKDIDELSAEISKLKSKKDIKIIRKDDDHGREN